MSNPTPKKPGFHRNWLSLIGALIAVGGFFAFLFLSAIELFAHHSNPYMGILAYVVAPGFMFLGAGIAVAGVIIEKRRHTKLTHSKEDWIPGALTIEFGRARDRKILAGFVLGGVVWLLCTAIGSYRTYHYSESISFCGEACHEPMKPEHVAYQNSPHARIACIECHVGPGATSYVKAKLNGVHQLYCTLTDNISRPIKTPIHNRRPANETCGTCHWSQNEVGNLDRTYTHFLADETNTQFNVRMLLKVGSSGNSKTPASGIHAHNDASKKIEYAHTDDKRLEIPWIRVTDAAGKVTEYKVADYKDGSSSHATRTMDCIDCHNRPAHRFQTPNAAVDNALAVGKIDHSLPWVKSNLVAVLTANYKTEAEALSKIDSTLRSQYKSFAKLDSLVSETKALFAANFFPEMKADWRAFPDHIGHKDSPGCFRCHDGKHKTPDGKKILPASDCQSCHVILAQGAGDQMEKLNAKGFTFFHVDADYEDLSCANCHTGSFPQ